MKDTAPTLKSIVAVVSHLPVAKLALPALFLVAVALAFTFVARRAPDSGSSLTDGPRVTAPRDARIKVQVLNASQTPGLAARAVRYLRDRGFDVVHSGNHGVQLDSTIVLDRSGRSDWARLVALALGMPRVKSEPDTSFYLDVTVLLGPDWRPPR